MDTKVLGGEGIMPSYFQVIYEKKKVLCTILAKCKIFKK